MDGSMLVQYAIIGLLVVISAWVVLKRQFPGTVRKALVALALAGVLSIGLALAGAFGLMFNVGDWGWLIGSVAGAVVYLTLSRRGAAAPLVGAHA